MTAWRFRGTEGADAAVLKLKQLHTQDLIDLLDVTVLRWPQYASMPIAHEHVTDSGSKLSALTKGKANRIERSMIDAVKGDMIPGTSVLVLMSSEAAVDNVAKAFEGEPMELVRSDLSVQQQDKLRSAFHDPSQHGPGGSN
jgi:uncharacterized membrane protein